MADGFEEVYNGSINELESDCEVAQSVDEQIALAALRRKRGSSMIDMRKVRDRLDGMESS